jgi:3-mercaptopyruvate sulfurtransferase SseA
MGRFIIIAIGIITGCLLVAGCNSNELKVRSSSSPAAPGQPGAAPVFADGVRRVTVTELKGLLEKDQAIVIDVRTQEAYNSAHVRGARLIPEADVANHAGEMPKNKLIVTYCS